MTVRMDAELLRFLSDPKSYGLDSGGSDVTAIQHIETHISHVFLTSKHAFKIKKPLQLDFLDYTTLAKRKYFCQRELELNKRYAEELYVDVVAIMRDGHKFNFNGKGDAVEYAVKMQQFGANSLFSELLAQGKLQRKDLHAVVDDIARFHTIAEQRPEQFSYEFLYQLCTDNFAICRALGVDVLQVAQLDQAQELTVGALCEHRDLITARRATHVRLLHGDLHLRNICMFKGKPTLFDGIEFNDDYACCDTWADIAFLIMDLMYHMVPQFACAVLNRYLEATDDFAGLPLARLFTAYRAMVRAKVNCIELDEHLVHASADAARNHLALALQALHNSEPQIIAVGGLSGSGKSTLALALAEKLDAIVIRSDAVRKHLLNCALDQKAPASAYAEDVSQRTYAGMRERAVYALNSGRTVILDAVHAKESRREALQDFAATRGTPFTGLWCEVPHEVACARLIARHGDVSDADIGVLQQQSVRELGHLTWRKVDTSRPVQEIIEMLIDTM